MKDYLHLNNINYIGLNKVNLNFLDENSFSNADFSNSIIFDFININNGNEEEIKTCNNYGFQKFVDHIKKSNHNVNYVYISTISVLSDVSEQNAYVKSKKAAELYLINSGINYQLQRLSYPIGKGENNKRLISRLISDLRANKDITINNVLLNLNPVKDVVEAIYKEALKSPTTFISNNQYLYLKDVVDFLKRELNSKSVVISKEVKNSFTPISDYPIKCGDIYETLREMI